MAESEGYRRELREAVIRFACGQAAGAVLPRGAPLPKHINIYLFGPQGSGKTSFIRTCFRALYGSRQLDQMVQQLEHSLHRTDDGTSLYSVFSLTDRVCLHDTRGQREYTVEELQQLKLVLEGRARPNTLVQQRRRYWLLLREFWRSDDQMKRTFSKTVMLPKASLDTEPHFAFLVLDPNQQELLLEDEDFRQCYGSLVGDFSDRGVPHALLCTHGDTLTAQLRAALLQLPQLLGCRPPRVDQGHGGLVRPVPGPWSGPGPPVPPSMSPCASAPTCAPPQQRGVPPPPPAAPSPFDADGTPAMASTAPEPLAATAPKTSPPVPPQPSVAVASGAPQQQPPPRMSNIMRIVTNYTPSSAGAAAGGTAEQKVECDLDGNHVQQDIHTLLVLLDALRQADNHIAQRVAGQRPAPMPPEAENGCPLL